MVETRGRGENGQHETESEDGVLGVIRQRRWVAESREREEVRGHREEDSREGEVRGDYYGGREEFRAFAIEDEVGVEREFSSFTLTIAQLVVSIVRKCCTCQ